MNWSEIKEKYGDVKVKFNSYYKYQFAFKGRTKNGEEIVCYVGGTADGIYRFEVTTKEITIEELKPDVIILNDKIIWNGLW